MKKLVTSLLCTLIVLCSFSQGRELRFGHSGKEDLKYRMDRLRHIYPPYGLSKIQQMLTGLQLNQDYVAIPDSQSYAALSFREQFTYHMIYAEKFSQICAVLVTPDNLHEKIVGQLPQSFPDRAWSERQVSFFKNNRDSVLTLMRWEIARQKRVGLNFKYAIRILDAHEMIPALVQAYRLDRKDHDILTVLMLMMLKNKYEPFLKTSICNEIYVINKSRSGSYVKASMENQELILKTAMDYFNAKS